MTCPACVAYTADEQHAIDSAGGKHRRALAAIRRAERNGAHVPDPFGSWPTTADRMHWSASDAIRADRPA